MNILRKIEKLENQLADLRSELKAEDDISYKEYILQEISDTEQDIEFFKDKIAS